MTIQTKPIPFSAPMVQALLREIEAPGTGKTQTRRIIKQASMIDRECNDVVRPFGDGSYFMCTADGTHMNGQFSCPYGKPGDLLYVRESYFQRGHWEPVNSKKTKGGKQKWEFTPESHEIQFSDPDEYRMARDAKDPFTVAWHKRLGRFMPRRYSRITLEVTDVRVERLQDISEADAKAEGAERNDDPCDHIRQNCEDIGCLGPTFKCGFADLWCSINGDDNWRANPWVWAVTFTPHLINVDQFIKGRAVA